jgi:hypothetical protein
MAKSLCALCGEKGLPQRHEDFAHWVFTHWSFFSPLCLRVLVVRSFTAEDAESAEEYKSFSASSALSAVKRVYHEDTKILVIDHWPLVIIHWSLCIGILRD